MSPLLIATALLIGTVAVARFTRLATSDAYPPAVWLRLKWLNLTRNGKWSPLLTCPFCFAPYAAAADLAWAYSVDLTTWADLWSAGWWWWAVNVWLAVSYAAAMIVVRDEPPEEG